MPNLDLHICCSCHHKTGNGFQFLAKLTPVHVFLETQSGQSASEDTQTNDLKLETGERRAESRTWERQGCHHQVHALETLMFCGRNNLESEISSLKRWAIVLHLSGAGDIQVTLDLLEMTIIEARSLLRKDHC
ncbi:Dna Repair Protein Complementing Xp-C Cells [Manis pentadactyla]|nr:Dna Repair Protein Complementing Xp-C Cells [Manis pentadactyla]